jgi:hypothetical protein
LIYAGITNSIAFYGIIKWEQRERETVEGEGLRIEGKHWYIMSSEELCRRSR